MNFLEKISFAKNFFSVVEDVTRTQNIFNIARIGLRYPESNVMKKMLKFVFSNEEFKKQFEDQYLMGPVDVPSLADLPEGSFGKEYYKFMTKNGLKADFYPHDDTREPHKYVAMRTRETHDILHVLAGYDTSAAGELAVQAFMLAQTKSGFNSMLLAVGFLHVSRHETADIFDYMDLIRDAFDQGAKAKFMLAVKFETLWDRPLDDVRHELKIGPAATTH